ncbi:AAA family ATPase [Nocardia higoensis]|uniref:AAA family ATPase n=1 Tax=Nocardia higoensis TaxID=228599 RepID=UPI0002E98B66|nr:ATP-binding protein [Nocardia higoensis]
MGWQRSLDTAGAASLAALVAQRIAADPTVPPDVETVVLGALGDSFPAASGFTDADGFGFTGVFLRAIRVRGFRGIGAQAELALRPGPGLTLVVGRNGSGKSSFAEAAELALTGGNRRWDGRSAEWREGWRNLHDGAGTRIELELLTAGAEPAPLVVKEWDARATLDEARWSLRQADGTAADFDAAAWAPVLDLYRPFLSYSELGSLVDGRPSDLFDALHQLLGLDELIAAQDRLRSRRLDGERAAKQARADRAALLAELDAIADERAARAASALRAERPDLAALAEHLRGDADTGDTTALRAILALTVPDSEEVAAVADRLVACAAALDQLSTTDVDADLRTFDLLRRARAHAAAAGLCPCPVCGGGTLDQDWIARHRPDPRGPCRPPRRRHRRPGRPPRRLARGPRTAEPGARRTRPGPHRPARGRHRRSAPRLVSLGRTGFRFHGRAGPGRAQRPRRAPRGPAHGDRGRRA